jgi:acyl carrier protein
MQDKTNIQERVAAILIYRLGVYKEDVNSEADIQDDLGADSLDMVAIIMDSEREFNISIPDDVAERIETVGQLVDVIHAKAN